MITNNMTLKNVLCQCQNKYEYTYELKVFGRFNDEKLLKIRRGAIIKGVKLGPFFVSLIVSSKKIFGKEHSSFNKKSICFYEGY